VTGLIEDDISDFVEGEIKSEIRIGKKIGQGIRYESEH
jgi:hypothetical protein